MASFATIKLSVNKVVLQEIKTQSQNQCLPEECWTTKLKKRLISLQRSQIRALNLTFRLKYVRHADQICTVSNSQAVDRALCQIWCQLHKKTFTEWMGKWIVHMAFGLFECAASFHRTDCFLLRLSLTHLINECNYEQDKIKPCDVTFTLVQTCFLLRKTLNQFVHSKMENNFTDQPSPEWQRTEKTPTAKLCSCNTVHVNIMCTAILVMLPMRAVSNIAPLCCDLPSRNPCV